ncbi:MAG: hypothetical protein ACJ8FY_05050 [Gemmataceae bacterium]
MGPTAENLTSEKRQADFKAKKQKAHEKSFDSLQRIHAVIFALAIGEAVKRILTIDDSTHTVKPLVEYLPQFFTLILTIIPFYHGSHRHFDDRYVFNERPVNGKYFLFFELLACLLTACVFFWLSLAIKEEAFFYILTGMLAFNCVWGLIAWAVHGAGTWKWSTINIFTVAIFLSILFPLPLYFGNVAATAFHLLPLAIIFFWDILRAGWEFFHAMRPSEQYRKVGTLAPVHLRTIILLSLFTAVIILIVWLFYWCSEAPWHDAIRQGAFLFVAAFRTFFDYYWRWNFYFPEVDGAES